MAEETESGASLLARREYARAVPLLKREHEKYPSNPRIRLQYADALSGAGMIDDAVAQYEATARYYEDNGLTVQAIAVRKKAEKLSAQLSAKANDPAGKTEPLFSRPVPKSPLFEVLNDVEREAFVREMELETHDEGSVVLSEGDPGNSMYLIASGEVKVFTRAAGPAGGGPVYLARLGEGDFFGEVSVLSGKPRTATITASQRTELLRLDKEKLDGVLAKHPGIRTVLDDFYKKRAKHTVEAMIESLKKR